MPKIIIDTDPGVDDAMAIALAVVHPDIELLGLTTVFGNVSVDLATTNALALLDQFTAATRSPAIPVAKGAAVPITQKPYPHPDYVHGKDGMGNIHMPVSTTQPNALDAASFIVEQANLHPGDITLVAVGPLTNIYLALQLDADLPSKVAQLVIMGGSVDEPGNVSPLAEANFLGDPHAADAVLGVDWPATIVGLDVTHKVMLFDSDLAQLRDHAGSIGRLIWESSRFYVNFYSHSGAAASLPEPGCAMHDAAAVVYVLIPEAFETVSGAARVVDDGVAVGQLALNRCGYAYLLKYWDSLPATKACMDLNVTKVKSLFLSTLIEHCADDQEVRTL